jgi:hypothetical protein
MYTDQSERLACKALDWTVPYRIRKHISCHQKLQISAWLELRRGYILRPLLRADSLNDLEHIRIRNMSRTTTNTAHQ